MSEDTPPIKKLLIIGLITICLTVGILCNISETDGLKCVKVIEKSKNIVTLTSYPSSVHDPKSWKIHTGIFINKCPACGQSGVLKAGIKRHDEITCTHCDSDFSVYGNEKWEINRAKLTQCKGNIVAYKFYSNNGKLIKIIRK